MLMNCFLVMDIYHTPEFDEHLMSFAKQTLQDVFFVTLRMEGFEPV